MCKICLHFGRIWVVENRSVPSSTLDVGASHEMTIAVSRSIKLEGFRLEKPDWGLGATKNVAGFETNPWNLDSRSPCVRFH